MMWQGRARVPLQMWHAGKQPGEPDDESVGAGEADVVEVDMHFPPLDLPEYPVSTTEYPVSTTEYPVSTT